MAEGVWSVVFNEDKIESPYSAIYIQDESEIIFLRSQMMAYDKKRRLRKGLRKAE